MKYFLYANGMPFDGNTIEKGESLGGSETMAYLVARELAKREHSVFMFSNIPDGKPKTIDNVNYTPIGAIDQHRAPFGSNFERHAVNIPCDVILAQRFAGIFNRSYNSKLNYFWAHDLALKRFQGHVNSMLWNTDRFFGVSDFHSNQIKQVYNPPEGMVATLQNGIDLDLWKGTIDIQSKLNSKIMLYGARPERGLIHLVKEGGVMEKLFKFDPEIKLVVCTYDNNHPDMNGLYNYLYSRCQALPNVENIGPQSQKNLATIEKNSWLYVYPTEFEDTSCLMVMQNAAAGTPFVSCKAGALEETGNGSGVYWGDLNEFEKSIIYLAENQDKWKQLHKKSLDKAQDYSIANTVDRLEAYVEEDFKRLTSNKQRMYEHFVYNSEIYGADKFAEKHEVKEYGLRSRYKTDKKKPEETKEFYDKTADRNFEIGNKHGMEDPARLLGMGRLQPVIAALSKLPSNARILDYGCCVGQVSFALKTRFPDMVIDGVDISQGQIDVAKKYAKEKGITGMNFFTVLNPADLNPKTYDAVLCLEVLEHIWDHMAFLNDLTEAVKTDGTMLISTPFGPYEENSDDPDPLYQHLHNFEESDIVDMIGEKTDKFITYISDQDSKKGEKLGNYVWAWKEDRTVQFGEIDWKRKFKYQRPRQRVSACMIVRPDGNTFRRCLESISPIVDELIIGVDDPDWKENYDPAVYQSFTDSRQKLAYQIGREFGAKFIPIESPLKQGFAEARNKTIEKATKDFILWIDDDETFVWPERFGKFLRDNAFDSYSLNHHHISADPVGLLKTDYPARVFRNNVGIKFYGIVHEHPEKSINEGPGRTFVVPRELGCIMHYGYETEEIRRKRFIRNYSLMVRDRQENPDRKLGKFLWIRDLSHHNRFDMERNGGQVTAEMMKRCQDALDLWRSELNESTLRMIQDSMQYVSECVQMKTHNQGLQFKIGLHVNSRGIGDDPNGQMAPVFQGVVETEDDLKKLQEILLRDKLNAAEIKQVYI